jgi:hypothetical protein
MLVICGCGVSSVCVDCRDATSGLRGIGNVVTCSQRCERGWLVLRHGLALTKPVLQSFQLTYRLGP